MKRIGKVLLGALILLLYMGVISLGVMVVIEEPEEVRLFVLSGGNCVWRLDTVAKELRQSAKEVYTIMEKEQVREEKIVAYMDSLLSEMTLEQKLAQRMILTNEQDITAANLQLYQPGGVIFFESDFRGKKMETVRRRVDTLQSYMKLPLFVGVDEEGGQVSRLKTLAETDIPTFDSARELAVQGTDEIFADTEEKMQYLKDMGINLNFAPVADVVENRDSYMYQRSAGGDAKEVASYVKTVLSAMEEQGVMGCMKHFPGYGDNVNTHTELAFDDRTLLEYESRDFLPFQEGIAAGADMIMVSHIIMQAVDDKNPASLSGGVHDILRDDVGFSGVIIADDLNMQAILKTMTIGEATVRAFVAGNDMIFSANFTESMKAAEAAVLNGELTEEQLDASVRRILRMKIDNGLIAVEEE